MTTQIRQHLFFEVKVEDATTSDRTLFLQHSRLGTRFRVDMRYHVWSVSCSASLTRNFVIRAPGIPLKTTPHQKKPRVVRRGQGYMAYFSKWPDL